MSSIKDYFEEQNLEEALEQAKAAREECELRMRQIDQIIVLLEYYVRTGNMLDPADFGIAPPEDYEDD